MRRCVCLYDLCECTHLLSQIKLIIPLKLLTCLLPNTPNCTLTSWLPQQSCPSLGRDSYESWSHSHWHIWFQRKSPYCNRTWDGEPQTSKEEVWIMQNWWELSHLESYTYLCVVPADLLRGGYRVGILILRDGGEDLELLFKSKDLFLSRSSSIRAAQLLCWLFSNDNH